MSPAKIWGDFMNTDKGIPGSGLKIIAIIAMLIETFGLTFIMDLERKGFIHPIGNVIPVNNLFKIGGSAALVVLTLLLAEGFTHTLNLKYYVIRMAVAALMTEFAYDYLMSGGFNSLYQSVLVSYIIALFTLMIVQKIDQGLIVQGDESKNRTKQILGVFLVLVTTLLGMAVSEFFRGDYGCLAIMLVVFFYFFRNKKAAILTGGLIVFAVGHILHGLLDYVPLAILSGQAELLPEIFSFRFAVSFLAKDFSHVAAVIGAIIGLIFASLYNGKKGYQASKIAYYLFFPLHMLLMTVASTFLIVCLM